MAKSILITPVYGYGWSKGPSIIDVPDPFQLDVSQSVSAPDSVHFSYLLGQICQHHTFEGFWVFLHARTGEQEPNYNAYIYSAEIVIDPLNPALPDIDALASGFAQVSAKPDDEGD
tara:strand:+ start:569 stop:916 length:348 start_codon:yes stop_codon:yes gene_type:complete